MKRFLLLCAFLYSCQADSQHQNFDLLSYQPPTGWQNQSQMDVVQFVRSDESGSSFAILTMYKSIPGEDNSKQNFLNSWNRLSASTFHASAHPQMQAPVSEKGWQVESGVAPFEHEGTTGVAMLMNMSANRTQVNILILTNTDQFQNEINQFVESIDIQSVAAENSTDQIKSNATAATGRYQFTTSNFDDGWISSIKENWVEVSRQGITVLIHFPSAETIKPADPDPLLRNAWDLLVAPHFKTLRNFKTVFPSRDYRTTYFGSGDVTDDSGSSRFVVLFRRAAGWIEFDCPDKASFVSAFGVEPDRITYQTDAALFNKMDAMNSYNKFAVASSDLQGKWTEQFSSNTFYSNMITGQYSGMSTYSSNQFFDFKTGNHYNWELQAVNSYGSQAAVGQGKGAGTFKSVGNWQLWFENIEGKPKTYDVYFTAVKGGRILWMNDALHPGSGIFKGFSR